MTILGDMTILVVGLMMAVAVSAASLYIAGRRWQMQQEKADDDRSEIELLHSDVDVMRDEIGRLRAELEWVTAAVRILTAQLQAAGVEPAVNIDDRKPVNVASISLSGLRRKINRAFTIEGIEALAFDLSIAPDEIAGATKSDRVIALLEYVNQRGRLPDLLLLLAKERPHVKWDA